MSCQGPASPLHWTATIMNVYECNLGFMNESEAGTIHLLSAVTEGSFFLQEKSEENG